ncbi:MAG TPA: DUF6364 family protein [Hanamia sp.]|nr:DUF6364 family protein [Hanamia sp.]
MTKKVTLLLKDDNLKFAKKVAKKKGTSMSKMVDDYFALLKRIDKQFSKEKLDPWVQKFGGIVDTGKNEDIKSIYNID